jgi:pimeloyl-ACP methyl ester carboxylesterase
MNEANSHLKEEWSRHLTVHGANQNEDGSYSWKFDNYTHCMSPYDMPRDEVKMLWGRITAPVLLVSGEDSWFRMALREDPVKYFQDARHQIVADAGHWLHHDQLERFLELTRDFLAK